MDDVSALLTVSQQDGSEEAEFQVWNMCVCVFVYPCEYLCVSV